MINLEYKYIHFKLAKEQNPRTWVYNVFANDGNQLLGQVRWYPNWRQYGFYPKEGTVYEKTCLADIGKFCVILGTQQKEGIRPKEVDDD